MKKITSIISFFLAAAVCFGQNVPSERVYLSTDRGFYAAGETVYCSAFCLNENKELSAFSSIAYVELYSDKGMAASAKIGLLNGRGAGTLAIPADLPTGNYRLAAYTAIAKNIPGYDFDSQACTLSVYNTSSVQKASGVSFKEELAPSVAREFGLLTISGADGVYSIVSPYSDADVSISVYKDEGLPNYNVSSIYNFVNSTHAYTSYNDGVIPEYDGQILYATVTGADGKALSALTGTDVYIGCPGNNEDLYAAVLDKDGRVVFYTGNIYGEKDMAVMLKEQAGQWKVDFDSPFVGLSRADIPVLELSSGSKAAIEKLGVASQISHAFERDTLYTRQPVRVLPFLGVSRTRYKLDDYTRFRTMREVFTEILGGVSVRSSGSGEKVFIRCEDSFNQVPAYRPNAALVLIDGVPVLDHNLILDYDPLLVKSVEVFPYEYSFGNTKYDGVLSFNTYKGDMTGFKFGDNIKILSFKGVSYPLSFSNAAFPENYPSLRQTLYWMPVQHLSAGKAFSPDFIVPSRPGTYVIKVEGLTSDSKPLYKEFRISVE